MSSLGYNLTYFVQHIFLSQWPLCCVQLYLCCCLCCVVFYYKYTVYVSKKVHFAWFIVIILRNGSLHVSVKPSGSLTSIMGGYQSFKQVFISQKVHSTFIGKIVLCKSTLSLLCTCSRNFQKCMGWWIVCGSLRP